MQNVAPGANNTLRLLTLGIGGRAANVTESFPVDTVQSLYVVDLGAVAGVGLVTATSEFRKEVWAMRVGKPFSASIPSTTPPPPSLLHLLPVAHRKG